MADWSFLPPELARLIGNRLPTIEDYTAFTAVCQLFRSATVDEISPANDEVSQPPWLLLSSLDEDSSSQNSPAAERGLLSMYRHRNKFFMNLPELHGRRCWGSRYGWILTLGLDRQLHIFNPLNRRRIALPEEIFYGNPYCKYEEEKLVLLRKYSIQRALLIKLPPSSSFSAFNDFTIATTSYGELRLMRPDGWVKVKLLGSHPFVFDVICYKGQIYALSRHGRLDICSNFSSLDPPTAIEFVAPIPILFQRGFNFYVVESLGELLLVVRFRKEQHDTNVGCRYTTYGFDVYKLDFQTRKWIGIDNLENCALFVGGCESISLARPEVYNCRKNCIYFADDYYTGRYEKTVGHDMGIYDVEEEEVEPFYSGDDSFSSYSAPTWFVPNFT